MKKITIPLILAMLATQLFSCGNTVTETNVPARELLDGITGLFSTDESHDPAVYYSDAVKGDDNYLDEGYMSYLFYDEYDIDIPELDLIDEYAMAVPAGLYAFEVDVVKAKSTADANNVKSLIQSRLDQKLKTRGELENYNSSQLPVLDGGEIYVSGKYVFLIVTPDNEAVKTKITELFGTDSVVSNNDVGKNVSDNDISNIASNININITSSHVVTTAKTDLEPSAVPVLTLTTYSANNLVVLGGTCDNGALIHVRGSIKDWVFHTDYTNWLCEVEIPSKGVTTLYITQESPDKAESEPISVTVQARTDVDLSTQGVCQVMIGDYGQGHFFGQLEDWLGTNILNDKQVVGVTNRIKEKVDYLAKKDCELIYVIVPNPMAVYPETAPERYVRSKADTSRTEQFENAAEEAGATVIDLSDILNEHKHDKFKIFHKTDSHWTAYGAYWGYNELMSYISETWEDAAPLDIDGNFEFYNKEVIAGDMLTHLKANNTLIKEYDTFVDYLVDAVYNPELYDKGMNQLDFTPVKNTMTIKNSLSDADLPTAMIIRDSFSTNIFGYLNNSFSEVYWQSMWNYKFDKNYIENTNPDYYIVLVAERNIGNLLG